MLGAGDARIDFNADFRIGGKRKFLRGETEEIFHLRRRQVGGGAATPMKLGDATRTGDSLAEVLDFALQSSEIRRRDTVVFGDDHIAGAKKAQAFAKREVHVKRDRSARGFSLFVSTVEVVEAEIVAPDGRGRITGVARSRPVIEREKFWGNAKLFAFELEIQIGMLRVAHTKDTGFEPSAMALACCSMERSSSDADWPARIKASAFSTGVSG